MERFLKSRYRIGEKLGENPFSATYKGFYIGTHKPVVVKIYKRGTLNNHLIKSMRKKVKALTSLSFPSIAKLIDGDYGWQGFYYVREFINGKSLRDILEGNQPFTLEDTLTIAAEVCKVLKICHENKLIHGGISPNNIFIDDQGLVKVTDFVIEGAIKEAIEQKSEFVREGAFYLSPEELAGAQASVSSDIFSLGLVLFEMLSGKHPFLNGNKNPGLGMVLNKLRNNAPPLTSFAPAVPKPIEEIIARSLNRDPLLRFRSIDDLEKSLANRSIIINLPATDFPGFNYDLLEEEPAIDEAYFKVLSVQKEKQLQQIGGWIIKSLVLAILGGLGFALFQSLGR